MWHLCHKQSNVIHVLPDDTMLSLKVSSVRSVKKAQRVHKQASYPTLVRPGGIVQNRAVQFVLHALQEEHKVEKSRHFVRYVVKENLVASKARLPVFRARKEDSLTL